MEIKITESRNDPEVVAEFERMQLAKDIVSDIFFLHAPRTPGAFINRYRNRFKRLDELKAHHFEHRKS